MTSRVRLIFISAIATIAALSWQATALFRAGALSPVHAAGQQSAGAAAAPAGRTATLLPDGRWLLVGGPGAERAATIWDPASQTLMPTGGPLQIGRAFHSATLLADGTVLLAGGRDGGAPAVVPELFDPATGQFSLLSMRGAAPRAQHTATLLTDGRVLLAGGSDGGVSPLAAEIWDVGAQTVTALERVTVDRIGHNATLTADGNVLIAAGAARGGGPAGEALLIDLRAGSTARVQPEDVRDQQAPIVSGSLPSAGSNGVIVDTHLSIRFSEPMALDSLNTTTVTLSGPSGAVTARVVAAEQGRLAFVWPAETLADGASYALTVAGAKSAAGVALEPSSITFTTAPRPTDASTLRDDEEWIPDAADREKRNGWRANRPPSPWESLPPLTAPPGVTAISGRVLTLDGKPLPDVTLSVEGDGDAHSDRTGRFLVTLKSAATHRRVLRIDGKTASRPKKRYGFYEYGMAVKGGVTNILPFTIWSPKLDEKHQVTIPSPTTSEVVVTTSFIPGLELHLPPGATIKGEDGKPVTTLGITAIPVDRPPFPLARNVEVPVYFTIQPGSAYVSTAGGGPKGAQLVYPNYKHFEVGQRIQFFQYEPEEKGWFVYGVGAANAAQVVPDASTRLYEFTGAMINGGGSPPNTQPKRPPTPDSDPIDTATGLFTMQKTDLYLPDVIPVAMVRSYNSGDGLVRPFGRSMTHPYAMFLWSANQYQEADLILPDGGDIHYVRVSPGTGFTDAVFVHQETATTSATPTPFYKSSIRWNGDGWDLTLTDGTTYVFGENAPLQAIRDRYGNQVTIIHSSGQAGVVNEVISPHGRWLKFTYDTSSRISQVADNAGRTVAYAYDGNSNLSTVTDSENNVTTYTYDGSNQLATIKDGRNVVYLTNQYTNGRVTQQTLADPSYVWTLAYTVDGSNRVTRTDVTDPRGHVRRVNFNADGYPTSETQAFGTGLARTTTYERQTGTNLVTAVVDALSRRTEFTYDELGLMRTVTQLAGTPDAVTTRYGYDPKFHLLSTITDPLLHTWRIGYDTQGRITSLTDPLSHQSTVVMNASGQVTSVSDPLSHIAQWAYDGPDQLTATDPLNQVTRRFVDAAGRMISTVDALGRTTRMTVDKTNRVTSIVDALGGQTQIDFDPNGRPLSLTDPLSHSTVYTYDASDRPATRQDPLQKTSTYLYDGLGHLTQMTDRKGQVTQFQYDELDRLSLVTFADTSTIQYTYDLGDRINQIVDSINGTITRTFDGFNRVTSETTSEGSVSYTYDQDDRRATMTVAGQPQVTYVYDDANRLTSITQGTSVISMTYDNADRRSTMTYPNGVLATYGYDSANQLTSVTYTVGATTLGDLTYTYDAVGNRTSVGGSWARTGLPPALSLATYDAGNRIQLWGSQAFSYDADGNLASDGSSTYVWNARNQLVGITDGTTAAFSYDGAGRRRSGTTNGNTVRFLFDGVNVAQRLTSGGAPTANLLNGLNLDETLVFTDSSGTRSLLRDALGSTVEIADGSAALITHHTYEPFGATAVSGSSSANTAQFTGRENDQNGMYFYRARFYSTGLGRFVSEDPLGENGGGLNEYAYVRNNPVLNTDPLGLYVKNCTPDPKRVKPEGAGEPPFILPPMTECPTCHPDGVAPVPPDAPWTKIPSPPQYPADVTIYPDPNTGYKVVCSVTSICRYWPNRPYIPDPNSDEYKRMKGDPDWWKEPKDLPPDKTKPLKRKDCQQ
jgi:RHS repeat-associated protein